MWRVAKKMRDSEKLLGDVIAVIVEKVLMEMGIVRYTRVGDILSDHNLTFSDCYQNPDVLNFALKEVFENGYLAVVEKIKTELGGLEDNSQNLAKFVQKISE